MPSILRFLLSSILVNGESNLSISSSFIPIPVSRTITLSAISSSLMSSYTTRNSTSPSFVYLTALVRRLRIHCLILISSPYKTLGIRSSTITLNLSPLLTNRSLTMLIRLLIISPTSYSVGIISILPSSTLEKSRISLTIDRSVCEEVLISDAYPTISSSELSLIIISSIPRIALIGERIS